MTDDALLPILRSVNLIDEKTGFSEDGLVRFQILNRNTVAVVVGETLIRIPAEPGENDEGRHGWSLASPGAGFDRNTCEAALRVARIALEELGYIVWDGALE